MEDRAKGIQTESMQTTGGSETDKNTISDESPAKKASIFCFKKRRKAGDKMVEKEDDCESLSLKPANQDSGLGAVEGEVSNSLWTSGGAWLAFRRLVMLRRRPKPSLKKPTQAGSSVELEMQAEEPAALPCPKDQASPKMPCLRFSRSRKKPGRSETTEELGEKTDETESILNKKSTGESETTGLEGPLRTEPSPGRVTEERESDGEAVKNVDQAGLSAAGENSFAVETRPSPDCYTDSVVQSEIIHSEKVLETEQEKQIFQLHQGSLYGNPEDVGAEKFGFKVDLGPLLPQVLPETEPRVSEDEAKSIPAREAEMGPLERVVDLVEDRIGGKGTNAAVEVMLHSIPSTLEDKVSVCSDEGGKSEENRPLVMPGAGIVITITEAEEFQEEEEPSPAYEPFPFPQPSKKKGKKKANKSADAGTEGHTREGKPSPRGSSPLDTNGQESRTPEQHEVLLIETAATLVKAAIQSSIEQILNEMALEQNKQNSFL